MAILDFIRKCENCLNHSKTVTNAFVEYTDEHVVKKSQTWASLVAQWLRIRLPMQGTRVQALVWDDPTCCGAAKPRHHNY